MRPFGLPMIRRGLLKGAGLTGLKLFRNGSLRLTFIKLLRLPLSPIDEALNELPSIDDWFNLVVPGVNSGRHLGEFTYGSWPTRPPCGARMCAKTTEMTSLL